MPQPPFDLLILTAANATQAAGYAAQLAARERAGALPAAHRWLVLSDPLDQRVGSGAATLLALAAAASHFAVGASRPLHALFESRRVLILHSGGDSRRLPAYAAQGKLFAPLPCKTEQGLPADLFDLLLADLHAVPLADSGRILIAAGDLLLNIRRQPPDVNSPGVVGVAWPGDYDHASRHGVFVSDGQGHVTDFLQKPSRSAAEQRGAIRPDGTLLVDTGLVSIDPETAAVWLKAGGVSFAGRARRPVAARGSLIDRMARAVTPQIDLYQHMLMALVPGVTPEQYLANVGARAEHREVLSELFTALRGPAFTVEAAPWCQFLHLGSTREFLELVRSDDMTGDLARPESAGFIFNSDGFGEPFEAPDGSVIEACIAGPTPPRIASPGDNLIVGLPQVPRLTLPRGVGLACLPIGENQWAAIVFGTADDCKTTLLNGGTFANRPLATFLKNNRLNPRDLWPAQAEPTLWTARLWVVGALERVIDHARHLARGKVPRNWPRAPRIGLADLMPRVNHARLIAHRESARRRHRLRQLGADVLADPWIAARPLAEGLRDRDEADLARQSLARAIQASGIPLDQARVARLHDLVAARFPARDSRTQLISPSATLAFVRAAAGAEPAFPTSPPRAAILPDQIVWATTPVRVDLAGGWSDTPPVCNELGGQVVNAAITLNGQYPVQVVAKLRDDGRIRVSSIDLGSAMEIASAEDAAAYTNPHDWAALPKAALVLSGIVPNRPGAKLSGWLRAFGGGLDLTIFAALPKGSGLGTSSILGAAILAAIDRVLGKEPDHASLIRRTSILEQMMSTAGGWQDQAGGITPGIKFLVTQPGPLQVPGLQSLSPPTALLSRGLLYYTGMRRLARDILQNVVNRYLERDPACITTIHQLKQGAQAMAGALLANDADTFLHRFGEYGRLKRAIDPGSTNARIEAMVSPIEKYLDAYELPGAGGGGFLLMIAKDPAAAESIRRALIRKPPNALARFFDFAIDTQGLQVKVL